MRLIRLVKVGDVLGIYAGVNGEGRTSLAIGIEVWSLRNRIGARQKVIEAVSTFASIDDEGRPRPLPGVE